MTILTWLNSLRLARGPFTLNWAGEWGSVRTRKVVSSSSFRHWPSPLREEQSNFTKKSLGRLKKSKKLLLKKYFPRTNSLFGIHAKRKRPGVAIQIHQLIIVAPEIEA